MTAQIRPSRPIRFSAFKAIIYERIGSFTDGKSRLRENT